MAIILVTLLLCLILSVPVSFSLIIASAAYILANGLPLMALAKQLVVSMDSYTLLAIPAFILAGQIMNMATVTERIFNFGRALVGHIPGGLAHANVVASIIFSGMSGSAIADTGGLGTVEIEGMVKEGYGPEFSAAVTGASAIIGPIIPPSIVALIYAASAEVSVGALFMAGVIPGLLMGLFLMVLIYFLADKYNTPVEKKASRREILQSFVTTFWALLTPGIILGGIFFGVFTPTEAAAIASFYAVLLGSFIYREMSLREFYKALIDSMSTTIQIMFIVVSATLFAWILAKEQVPQMVAEFMLSHIHNYYLILFAINILLIIVGCFMETVAAINILVPVFIPLMKELGIDPVHFGVMMILNLMIGILTPPFGTVLFVLSSVAKVPVERVAKDTALFILPLLVVLILIVLFPQLTLFLPNLFFGK